MSRDLKAETTELLKHEVVQRHSFFQLKYFLIGKEPTVQSKMWQCLRELKQRRESLDAIELERDEVKDKIALIDISMLKLTAAYGNENQPELDRRELEIRIRQTERQKKALIRNLEDLDDKERWLNDECLFFVETFKNLEKVEPLRPFDDIEAQSQYWNEKLTQKANIKMLTQNTIDSELIETIVALPNDLPIKKHTLQNLNIKQEQMLQQLREAAKKLEGQASKEK
jgi:hypothetical protein